MDNYIRIVRKYTLTCMKSAGLGVLILLGFSIKSHAAATVSLLVSSAPYAGAIVSSGSLTTRVDIFATQGSSFTAQKSGRMQGRNEILVQNQDSANPIFCAYDALFTTATTNAGLTVNLGRKISAGEVVNISLAADIPYHCKATDAAGTGGVVVHLEQAKVEKVLP